MNKRSAITAILSVTLLTGAAFNAAAATITNEPSGDGL